jgi:hypothetical protein
LLKQFVITPEQRYMFKAALDRAIRAVNGLPQPSSLGERVMAVSAKEPMGAGADADKPTEAPHPAAG